jgi:hypothetical protein
MQSFALQKLCGFSAGPMPRTAGLQADKPRATCLTESEEKAKIACVWARLRECRPAPCVPREQWAFGGFSGQNPKTASI